MDSLVERLKQENAAVIGLARSLDTRITTLQSDNARLQARVEELERAHQFIADMPDPGEEKDRTALFYRIHAAQLKQISAKALGRETVSPEAMEWAAQALKEQADADQ